MDPTDDDDFPISFCRFEMSRRRIEEEEQEHPPTKLQTTKKSLLLWLLAESRSQPRSDHGLLPLVLAAFAAADSYLLLSTTTATFFVPSCSEGIYSSCKIQQVLLATMLVARMYVSFSDVCVGQWGRAVFKQAIPVVTIGGNARTIILT